MNYEETKELLKQYLLARIPFISINTIEKSRATAILKQLSTELNIPISICSMSNGISDIVTNDKLKYGKILHMF